MGNSIKIIPLGGVGEIGKNITVIEYKDIIIAIDCGMAFPDEEMFGVDVVIPDVTYLINNKDRFKGIFLTHGHEDHIGGLPYILKQVNVPVYGTRFSLALVELKLKEHGILENSELNNVTAGEKVDLGDIQVEFIRNSHSIADSCSLAIHTPEGTIVHSGDFKVDYTPIDKQLMDFGRLAELGNEGVLLLLSDSTNAERPGYTLPEKIVGRTFDRVFGDATGRIIIASFASNTHRIQQIFDAAVKFNRKVAVSGRSMENIIGLGIELGYLDVAPEVLINIDDISRYPDDRLIIITTGSQGEPMSALSRIAYDTHKKIKLQHGDLVVISASPIPGNERFISRVINELYKKGASVVYKALEEIHVSGHACQEELKLLHRLIRPKFFMPVHGEYRHLWHHGTLAEGLGMSNNNIFILEIGQVLEVTPEHTEISGKVPSGKVLVDGLGVGDVGNIVLRDRKHLAQDGIITVVVTIEKESFSVIAGPDIISRGFVYMKESEELIDEIKSVVKKTLDNCLENRIIDWFEIKSAIKKGLGDFIYEKIKRNPIILPIIMEI